MDVVIILGSFLFCAILLFPKNKHDKVIYRLFWLKDVVRQCLGESVSVSGRDFRDSTENKVIDSVVDYVVLT